MPPNSKKKKFLICESQDLVSKLKPAFEDVIEEENASSPSTEELSQLSISSNKSCSTCGVNFETTEEQRAHFKLDWHRFNIANKLKGLKSISEDQFENQLDSLSLSGSESDDDPETQEEKIYEKTSRLPKIFLTHQDNPDQVYSIHKAVLPDFKTNSCLKWAIFMLGGGHFAGAVFDKSTPILHKTFHCYTVRAKQGGSQSSADNRSGSNHKSAGASLRRYNEQSLIQHVQDILVNWKSDLEKCSLIFLRAVSGNRKVLFGKIGKDAPLLDKNDKR